MAVWPAGTMLEPAIFVGEPSGALEPDALGPMPWLVDDQFDGVGVWVEVPHLPAVVVELWPSQEANQSAGTFDFYEDFHVVPRAFDFGNLLSDQSVPIEVFSAFRHDPHTWTAFVNNAGSGITLTGAPSLPNLMPPLTGHQMTLDVSAIGTPFVDGTLDFVFDIGTILVPIMVQRIVLWGAEPEMPWTEALESLTDIIPKRDGTEQRIGLRKHPRHSFRYLYKLDTGASRETLENLLFDWQSRIFGVPKWRYESNLTVAATAGASSITVDSTAFRDYRVSGLVVIMTSQTVFDVLSILSFTSTSITFDSLLINSYPVGTRVFPLATCHATRLIAGQRYPVNLGALEIEFTNTDNDVDLANLAPFNSYGGKLLLDRFNSVLSGTVRETFDHEIIVLDNETGEPVYETIWTRHKRGHLFTLRAQGLQEIWEMWGMLYALDGRRVSFYTPALTENLVVVSDLLSGSNLMTVTNYGYAQFVRQRQPKDRIRITLASGTILLRTITGSVNVSPTTDQLSVDVNWVSTVPFATIVRVEYLEEIRFDVDRVEVEFEESGQRAYLAVPLRAVFE